MRNRLDSPSVRRPPDTPPGRNGSANRPRPDPSPARFAYIIAIPSLPATAMLATLPLLLLPLSATDTDCAALYRQHRLSDLDLPVDQFDQTEGRGFRVLAAAGCMREAGDLLEAWAARHDPIPRSVHWHIAQMRAEHDDRPAAIAAARRALAAPEAADAVFRWNDYVLATIAFLERDRSAFDRHRDAVAAAAGSHAGNALNLQLLDKLGRHFDLDYRQAQQADRTPP
ncbi:MAG: hypothetical protein J0H86_22690 [Xanthomonadaceae bacterium]|nr:hypothetical protein [Xanthomonadaceae bacterium]ODV16977.1 MAG: hypothetical protein ABT27_18630 [Xanthomonadaceae bacterium SCN 69-25]